MRDLQRALLALEAARKIAGSGRRDCPIGAAIHHVEDLLGRELDEAPHTPTAVTVKVPTIPPRA